MFLWHWLLHQLYLTWRQLTIDITIPHIITGVVLYSIVHFATKNGQKSALRAEKLFKNAVQERIYHHVHAKHQGKPVDCPDCATIVTVDEFTLL